MNNATSKFEIVIGLNAPFAVSEFSGTLDEVKAHVADKFGGTRCVLRGYTTFRIYDAAGKAIGSMQSV